MARLSARIFSEQVREVPKASQKVGVLSVSGGFCWWWWWHIWCGAVYTQKTRFKRAVQRRHWTQAYLQRQHIIQVTILTTTLSNLGQIQTAADHSSANSVQSEKLILLEYWTRKRHTDRDLDLQAENRVTRAKINQSKRSKMWKRFHRRRNPSRLLWTCHFFLRLFDWWSRNRTTQRPKLLGGTRNWERCTIWHTHSGNLDCSGKGPATQKRVRVRVFFF